jgi:hypothetical protein
MFDCAIMQSLVQFTQAYYFGYYGRAKQTSSLLSSAAKQQLPASHGLKTNRDSLARRPPGNGAPP